MMALSVNSDTIQNKITLNNGHEIKSDALAGKTQQQLKDLKVSNPGGEISGLKNTTFKDKGEFAFIDELGKNTFYAFHDAGWSSKQTFAFTLDKDNSRTGTYLNTVLGSPKEDKGTFAIVDKVDDKGTVTGHEIMTDIEKQQNHELMIGGKKIALRKDEKEANTYWATKPNGDKEYKVTFTPGSLEATVIKASDGFSSGPTQATAKLVQADGDSELELALKSEDFKPVDGSKLATPSVQANTAASSNSTPAAPIGISPANAAPPSTAPASAKVSPGQGFDLDEASKKIKPGEQTDLATVRKMAFHNGAVPNVQGYDVVSKNEDGGFKIQNKAGETLIAYSFVDATGEKQTYLIKGDVQSGDSIIAAYNEKGKLTQPKA